MRFYQEVTETNSAIIERAERRNGSAPIAISTEATEYRHRSAQAQQTNSSTGKIWVALAMPVVTSLLLILTGPISRKSAVTRAAWRILFAVSLYSRLYLVFIRRWHARWGATDGEVRISLPGDDLVQDPWV